MSEMPDRYYLTLEVDGQRVAGLHPLKIHWHSGTPEAGELILLSHPTYSEVRPLRECAEHDTVVVENDYGTVRRYKVVRHHLECDDSLSWVSHVYLEGVE